MKKFLLLLFIPIVCISGHSQSLEPDKYKFEHNRSCYVGEDPPKRNYILPRIPSYVKGDYRTQVLENIFECNVWMDGKKFQSAGNGGRFQFTQVTYETKFILIDDIKPD